MKSAINSTNGSEAMPMRHICSRNRPGLRATQGRRDAMARKRRVDSPARSRGVINSAVTKRPRSSKGRRAQGRGREISRAFSIGVNLLAYSLLGSPLEIRHARVTRRVVLEGRVIGNEGQRHVTGRAVALLREDELRLALLRFLVVHLVAINEHHDVGVLFD